MGEKSLHVKRVCESVDFGERKKNQRVAEQGLLIEVSARCDARHFFARCHRIA